MPRLFQDYIYIDTPYGRKKIRFRMHRHFNGNDQDVMKAIGKWIANNADEGQWFNDGPLWFIRMMRNQQEIRVAHIPPGHPLWNHLDSNSRSGIARGRNYLSWSGHIMYDDTIEVLHFGPLGYAASQTNRQDDFDNEQIFIQDMLALMGMSKQQFDNLDPSQQSAIVNQCYAKIRSKYIAVIEEIKKAINITRVAINVIIKELFGDVKEAAEITAAIALALTPTILKIVLKETAIAVTKQVAKEIAVITAKASAKKGGASVAKKIPVAGAIVGGGFAIWRLCQGDKEGAALEMSSGVASCVPGGGTVASLGIDAVLAARDIKQVVDYYKGRQNMFETHSMALQHEASRLEEVERNYNALTRTDIDFFFDEQGTNDFIRAVKFIL